MAQPGQAAQVPLNRFCSGEKLNRSELSGAFELTGWLRDWLADWLLRFKGHGLGGDSYCAP